MSVRLKLRELRGNGGLDVVEREACQFAADQFGREPFGRDETRKRVEKVIAKPSPELVVEVTHDWWVARSVNDRPGAQTAGDLRFKNRELHVAACPFVRLAIVTVRRQSPVNASLQAYKLDECNVQYASIAFHISLSSSSRPSK